MPLTERPCGCGDVGVGTAVQFDGSPLAQRLWPPQDRQRRLRPPVPPSTNIQATGQTEKQSPHSPPPCCSPSLGCACGRYPNAGAAFSSVPVFSGQSLRQVAGRRVVTGPAARLQPLHHHPPVGLVDVAAEQS